MLQKLIIVMSWELFKYKPWDALLVLMQSQYYLVYLYFYFVYCLRL